MSLHALGCSGAGTTDSRDSGPYSGDDGTTLQDGARDTPVSADADAGTRDGTAATAHVKVNALVPYLTLPDGGCPGTRRSVGVA